MAKLPDTDATLEQFGFRCELEPFDDRWSDRAFTKLLEAAEVDGVALLTPGWNRGDAPQGGVSVGINVVGFRKDKVILSYAAFDATTKRPAAWSFDLDADPEARIASAGTYVAHPERNGRPIPIDADMKERIKRAAGRAPKIAKAKAATLTHERRVLATSVTADGKYIVSTGGDGALCIWSAKDGARLHRITTAGGRGLSFLNAVATAPDGRTVVAGSKALKIYDIKTGKDVGKLVGQPGGDVMDVRFSPSGRWLASASAAEHSVSLWDVATGARLGTHDLGIYEPRRLTLVGERLVVVGGAYVSALDLPSLQVTKRRKVEDWGIDVAARGEELFVAQGETIVVMNALTLKVKHTFPIACTYLDVSSDGLVLACASQRGTALYRAKDGALLKELEALRQRRAAAPRSSPTAPRC